MSVEVRPLNVACNLRCTYCYQQEQRAAGNGIPAYNFEAMKAAIIREGASFTLFGGEPLLLPLSELEAFLRLAYDLHGKSGVQTNCTLVTPSHVQLFKSYNTSVGASIDGPDELNDARRSGRDDKTSEMTRAAQRGLEMLLDSSVDCGLIVVLHRGNAISEKLDRLIDWLATLFARGLRSVRLHLLEADGEDTEQLSLTSDENVVALRRFLDLERRGWSVDFFEDMRRLLVGRDEKVSCVWAACDPLSTAAVRGIEAEGELSNCGRTNKLGVDFLKADTGGHERQLVLYATPQAYGGCQDCRFFAMCKGQCPGTALSGDWRNRSDHCEVYKALFTDLEQELIAKGERPISASEAVRSLVESELVASWANGRNRSLQSILTSRFAT